VEKVNGGCGGGGEERASGKKTMESNIVSKYKIKLDYPLIPLTPTLSSSLPPHHIFSTPLTLSAPPHILLPTYPLLSTTPPPPYHPTYPHILYI